MQNDIFSVKILRQLILNKMAQEETQYLTKEKLVEFKNELDFLKTTKRKEVAENLEYAKALGDLSENAEYQEAREMQASVEDRIMRLETMMKTAVLLSDRHEDTVGVGSTVIIKKEGEKDNKEYKIVGSEEVDLSLNKISNLAPLGLALLGKKKKESVIVRTPNGDVHYSIIEVK
ncbi:MAG: transcription elongation factor GreA [Patescibacteria group bacterium]|nr:transcription elongation factor GreA [Patescibacteria group bacterium]